MNTTKVVNHLSIENLNMDEVLSQQDKFFANDDAVLILNGSVQRIPVFNLKENISNGRTSFCSCVGR